MEHHTTRPRQNLIFEVIDDSSLVHSDPLFLFPFQRLHLRLRLLLLVLLFLLLVRQRRIQWERLDAENRWSVKWEERLKGVMKTRHFQGWLR